MHTAQHAERCRCMCMCKLPEGPERAAAGREAAAGAGGAKAPSHHPWLSCRAHDFDVCSECVTGAAGASLHPCALSPPSAAELKQRRQLQLPPREKMTWKEQREQQMQGRAAAALAPARGGRGGGLRRRSTEARRARRPPGPRTRRIQSVHQTFSFVSFVIIHACLICKDSSIIKYFYSIIFKKTKYKNVTRYQLPAMR